jgi:8-oxo-dGTP pyrophosphatase MutT (NUDIX family)
VSRSEKENRIRKLSKTVDQLSAGGVAFRDDGGAVRVAIVSVNPSRRWQLPKGHLDGDETAEQAALREVREEAGIETEMISPLDTVEYWYYGNKGSDRVRYHKQVIFYLLWYVSGSVEDHDHEVAEARWVGIDEAIQMLAFKGETDAVKKAKQLIAGK